MTDDELRNELIDFLLAGNTEAATALTRSALEDGLGTVDFFNGVFTPALKDIGDRFGRLEVYLPEPVEAAETAKAISDRVIQPRISPRAGRRDRCGRVCTRRGPGCRSLQGADGPVT
jgi:trimethylamine corrinoid protein